MDIILVPGFWLDASSWDDVTPALERAGHRVHPLTLPGLESPDADRGGIGLRDHIDAVVAVVDRLSEEHGERVVLVGHSGGGAVIHGAVDARPDRVARAIYVDSGPLGEGGAVNDELPVEGADVPLPPWEMFEDADLTDFTDELRARFRARAIPHPARAASDPQRLSDERRYDVPATVIACEFPSSMLREWIAGGAPVRRRTRADPRRGVRRPAHGPLAPVHEARRARRGDQGRGRPRPVTSAQSPIAGQSRGSRGSDSRASTANTAS